MRYRDEVLRPRTYSPLGWAPAGWWGPRLVRGWADAGAVDLQQLDSDRARWPRQLQAVLNRSRGLAQSAAGDSSSMADGLAAAAAAAPLGHAATYAARGGGRAYPERAVVLARLRRPVWLAPRRWRRCHTPPHGCFIRDSAYRTNTWGVEVASPPGATRSGSAGTRPSSSPQAGRALTV